MIETPSRGRARRTPLDGTTASSRRWPLPLERAGGDPLAAGSRGSGPCREASGPRRGGADRARGASDPRGGDARLGRILGPPHAIGQAVRPVSRGWPAAPGEFRTRAGDQPAPPRPARPRFPARGPARRDGPGAPERSGAGARGARRPARAMIPERLCVSGGEPAPRRSRERRRVLRRPDEGGRDASRDHTLARAVAPAVTTIDLPAHGRVRHAINAVCVRVAGTKPGPSRSRKAAVTSSAGPDGGPQCGGPRRSGPARTGRPGPSTTRWRD